MSDTLKITKARVLKASASCSQAREVLHTLFPEAFKVEMQEPLPKGTIYKYTGSQRFVALGVDAAAKAFYKASCGHTCPEHAVSVSLDLGNGHLSWCGQDDLPKQTVLPRP